MLLRLSIKQPEPLLANRRVGKRKSREISYQGGGRRYPHKQDHDDPMAGRRKLSGLLLLCQGRPETEIVV